MTTTPKLIVGQTFTIPADEDDVTYEVRIGGVVAVDAHSVESLPIDPVAFAGLTLKILIAPVDQA